MGPILDMMAVVLENIPTNTIVAKTTISAVNQTAKIISSVPNILYHKKVSILDTFLHLHIMQNRLIVKGYDPFQAFPEALFHQLLLAMAHPDHETRVGAHHVFSTVLMPSLVGPWVDQNGKSSEAFSGFSVVNTLRSQSFSIQVGKNSTETADRELRDERYQIADVKQSTFSPAHAQSYSFKHAMTGGKMVLNSRLYDFSFSLLI